MKNANYEELCQKICRQNLSYEEIIELCDEKRINLKEFFEYFRKYIQETYVTGEKEVKSNVVANELKEEKNERSYFVPSKVDPFFEKVFEILKKYDYDVNALNIRDYLELVIFIKENEFRKAQLCDGLLGYLTKNRISTTFHDGIRNIINTCYDYIKKDKKENKNNKVNSEKIGISKTILYSFIESGLCIEDFCERTNITNKRIENAKKIVEQVDPELYNLFNNVYNTRKIVRETAIKDELLKLSNYLENGIVVNGIVREFTFVDYCALINLDFKKLLTYIKLIDDNEAKARITRFRNVVASFTYNVSAIANRMINANFTLKTNDGTLKNLTMEEKVMIIEYLKTIGVPMNEYTIYLAYELYVNNGLFEAKEEEKDIDRTC